MLKPDVREQLKLLLPAELWSRAIVAGGYAADEEKAADIDLWVIGGNMEADYRRIRTHNDQAWGLLEDSQYEQFSNEFAVVSELGIDQQIGEFGTRHWPVQILVSSATSFQDL